MTSRAETDRSRELPVYQDGTIEVGPELSNRFKRGLRNRHVQIGLWSSLCSHLVAEVLAGAGFDWIVIDAEHAPNELSDVVHQLQAMSGYPVEPVVRIPVADSIAIKRYLDAGVRSLLVPMVQHAEAAASIVAATRYPPAGIRGVSVAHRANRFGRVKDYLQRATEDLCVVVQIETAVAVKNIEAIASVDGIDGLFIGPSDLAADLGYLGDPKHPKVQAAMAQNAEDADRYLGLGFAFVAIGSDLAILARQSESLAASFAHWKKV
jgi:4-hydroxy-2-oxoheptanedioate aldolase